MDTRILEYFLAVAREENITRAAGILRVSQPSLSRQIMQLEEEIGKPLLIRGSKNVSLTPEGQLFKNRAEEILSLVDKTKKELLNDSDYIAGDIYLASMESEGFRPWRISWPVFSAVTPRSASASPASTPPSSPARRSRAWWISASSWGRSAGRNSAPCR